MSRLRGFDGLERELRPLPDAFEDVRDIVTCMLCAQMICSPGQK